MRISDWSSDVCSSDLGDSMTLPLQDSILIVDFGSQVTQLIARRVREAGVYSEIAPFNNAAEAFELLKPKGIILSGGPSSVMWEDSPRARSEEHTSELQSLMRTSYAVFCLKKQNQMSISTTVTLINRNQYNTGHTHHIVQYKYNRRII